MNPLNFVARPIKNLADAVLLPFKALWVVGLTGFINWATFSGHWWFKWVAFGMAMTVLVTWARAAKSLLLLAVVGFVGWKVYQRYGAQARQQFDDWVARAQPQTAQVLHALRTPARPAGPTGP